MTTASTLKDTELSWSQRSLASGRNGTRNARSAGTTSRQVTLTHLPTGLAVTGEIPPGQRTRGQMQAETTALERALRDRLQRAVAKHLRLPGR